MYSVSFQSQYLLLRWSSYSSITSSTTSSEAYRRLWDSLIFSGLPPFSLMKSKTSSILWVVLCSQKSCDRGILLGFIVWVSVYLSHDEDELPVISVGGVVWKACRDPDRGLAWTPEGSLISREEGYSSRLRLELEGLLRMFRGIMSNTSACVITVEVSWYLMALYTRQSLCAVFMPLLTLYAEIRNR